MQSSTNFEREIEHAISQKVEDIYPSEKMFYEINRKVEMEERKKYMKINMGKRTKGILAACLILILTTATCFAATHYAFFASSGVNNTFLKYPAPEEVKKEAGFLPKYVETFSNGYTFKNAGVGESTGNDENGNVLKKLKSIFFNYTEGDKSVFISIDDGDDLHYEENAEDIALPGNITGEYTEYINKMVSPDYEMTEQDKLDEANGVLVFSYGSDKVSIEHVQGLSWVDDGIAYCMICSDDGVDKEGMAQMAKEIIEK